MNGKLYQKINKHVYNLRLHKDADKYLIHLNLTLNILCVDELSAWFYDYYLYIMVEI
jgi:hypothetical protein